MAPHSHRLLARCYKRQWQLEGMEIGGLLTVPPALLDGDLGGLVLLKRQVHRVLQLRKVQV